MSKDKLDLDHLQAVAEVAGEGRDCPLPWCECPMCFFCRQMDPPTVLALIAQAREAEDLRHRLDSICYWLARWDDPEPATTAQLVIGLRAALEGYPGYRGPKAP